MPAQLRADSRQARDFFYVLEQTPEDTDGTSCFYAHAPEFQEPPDLIVPVGTGDTADEAIGKLKAAIQASPVLFCTSQQPETKAL